MASNKSGDVGLDTDGSQSGKAKRGKVVLTALAKRKGKNERSVVKFNDSGQSIGPEGSEMQSYIGILARTEVKITYKSWDLVPPTVKNTIWEHVNLSYEVPEWWRHGCLESACTKWRQWKHRLYKEFIDPNRDHPEKLENPPPNEHIPHEDWSEFVKYRLSTEFKKISDEQTKRAKMNEYPHNISRRGYAGLAEMMKDQLPADKGAVRCILWRQARLQTGEVKENKKGDAKENQKLQEAFMRIEEFLQKSEDGDFKSEEWGEDLLTCALGKREHSGRVRAVGSGITPSMYFRMPNKRVKNSCKKEQTSDLLAAQKQIVEQSKQIVEQSKQIVEQNIEISDMKTRLLVLEEAFTKEKGIEEKGSCSNKQACHVKDDEEMENNEEDDGMIIMQKVDTLQVCSPEIISPMKKNIQEQQPNKRKVKSYDSLSSSLKILYVHLEQLKSKDKGMKIEFDEGVFGCAFSAFVHLEEDMIPLCNLQPISLNSMVVYVWYLYQKLKKTDAMKKPDAVKKTDASFLKRILFVNPFSIAHVKFTPQTKRTIALSGRLTTVSSDDQLLIVPTNMGVHWILTIIDPHKEKVYVLDPLQRGATFNDDTWKNIVNTALSVLDLKKRNNKPIWEVVKCPRQPDGVQCGYFVMRYMRDIVEEFINSGSISFHLLFKNKKYSQQDIDEVRNEWATSVLLHV